MTESLPTQHRVLMLAPTERDGSTSQRLLQTLDIECVICRNLNELCQRLDDRLDVIVLPEEIVQADINEQLRDTLGRQPVWSDIPVIVLSRAGVESPAVAKAMKTLGNVTLIERPARVSTLVSAVQAAIRARRRQYEVRDHLVEQAERSAQRDALIESERAARSEAERVNRMKDEFLATLSHELRTPLNAILGWSQIMKSNGVEKTDIMQGLEVIERNARAQAQIIEDLLDMSRIISGKVRLDVQPVDLADLVQNAIDTTRPAAEAKHIKLDSVVDTLGGIVIHGDANRLQQVLWNLLTNAVKFTPRGGRVQARLIRSHSQLQFDVTDTGQGIKPEFLPFVFDRFRQADATTTRSHGGLGLGLSIVKQLVELHGGNVSVASDGIGMGSRFSFVLPVTAVVAAPIGVTADRHPTAERPLASPARADVNLEGLSVLVVDDEPDARELVARMLTEYKAVVRTAGSVAEALTALSETRFDVLVSDIGMPVSDGYDLVRHLRSRPADLSRKTPAIALTAYARTEDRVRALAAGFSTHLAKPVEPVELLATVATLAGRAVADSDRE